MKEELIQFDTAVLAKEKGFTLEDTKNIWDRYCFYHPNGNYAEGNKDYFLFNDKNKVTPAPTQSLLQKWLRDVHKIHVFPWCNASGWGWEIENTSGTHISLMDIDEEIEGTEPESGMFSTYEKALETGLVEALKLIKL